MQEARLQQLSVDLRSEVSSGSLTELKDMISNFMQELKDSMLRQSQTQPSVAFSLGSQTEPLSQLGAVANDESPAEVAPVRQRRDHSNNEHDSVSRRRSRPAPEEARLSSNLVHSQNRSLDQSVITEDDIELDLPESHASSIPEEGGLAASPNAVSVAESVSDLQYSMDFEGSIYRSPMSGFQSPAPGDQHIALQSSSNHALTDNHAES